MQGVRHVYPPPPIISCTGKNEAAKPARISLYDNLKFVLILSVVVGHFIDIKSSQSNYYKSIFVYIYTFHMPLFLFLSGLFHKNENILQKTLTFICIGFMLKITFFLFGIFLYGKASFSFLSDSGIPWYMFVLAIYIALSYGLRNIDKRFILFFSLMLGCFVGYDAKIGDYLYISRTVVFYPFFVLGMMADKERLMQLTRKKWLRGCAVTVLCLWLVLCFSRLEHIYSLRPLFTGRNPFKVNGLFVKWGFAYRILCYAITCAVGFSIVCVVTNRKLTPITLFGSRTLYVYFWHWPVAMVLQKYGIATALCESREGKFMWILCAVATTFCLSLKIFSFPVAQTAKFCKYARS